MNGRGKQADTYLGVQRDGAFVALEANFAYDGAFDGSLIRQISVDRLSRSAEWIEGCLVRVLLGHPSTRIMA